MKILVICQYYAPEPFRIADVCEELVKRGHEVTVVTGIPNYPMGYIYEGYRNGKKRDETINGVKVHRCFTIGRRHGIFFRFLNYYSYMFSSAHYVKKMTDDYDVVFVNQLSPIMMAKAGIVYKRKHKVPLVMYCLDLWPESLCVGGIKKSGIIYKYFHKISKKIYQQADKLLASGKSFMDYFSEEFGITDVEYLPQYAEALFTPKQCKKEPDGYVDLMFTGNIGIAQSTETIIKAAKLTRDIPNLRWHIVGDGSELEKIKAMAKDTENIFFHGRKPLDEMPQYYAMADAMLVTMKKGSVLKMTLPGKVQSYMAAGKPIVASADSETEWVISSAKCGLCGKAEDCEKLASNVRLFVNANKDVMAKNASAYYERYFEKERFFNTLLSSLERARYK